MIQNAENVVPSATIAVENKENHVGTRLRPKMRTPKKLASSMKAVKVSYIRSGPWIGPDILDNTLQFVPNWNAITIPDTTPSPNATPNIFSQNSKITRYTGRPVARRNASRTVSHAANPNVMV